MSKFERVWMVVLSVVVFVLIVIVMVETQIINANAEFRETWAEWLTLLETKFTLTP